MFSIISSIHSGFLTLCFLSCIFLLLTHFLKKLLHMIVGDKDINSGHIMITGCDTGFGYEAALEFSKRGLYVFAGCLAKNGVDRLNGDENFNGIAILINITKNGDVQNARKLIEEKIGDEGLYCLLNNAGVLLPGPIEWMSIEDMKTSMNVNSWGTVNVTKTMLPLVKKAHGRIINTTSIAGRFSLVNGSSYCMSKYALEAFSDSLRHEMKPWGVGVHIIEPGFHDTGLFTRLTKRWRDLWDEQPEEIKAEYGEEYVETAIQRVDTILSKGFPSAAHVVNAYIHSALSAQPRLRYVVGTDANTIYMLIATLPTAVGDFIYSLLNAKNIPAALKKEK